MAKILEKRMRFIPEKQETWLTLTCSARLFILEWMPTPCAARATMAQDQFPAGKNADAMEIQVARATMQSAANNSPHPRVPPPLSQAP